jgi:histidyl-tRNA synthetase
MTTRIPTAPLKGMRDFLPAEMSVRRQIFGGLFEHVERFGYQPYDGPLLEPVSIYEAKSGEEIANQQLYRLTDKGDRVLALRPEMTPTVARIVAGHRSELTFPLRWYCLANCFRYERPQRGRTREHWQLNVDMFGVEALEAEVEMFDLISEMFRTLGADTADYELLVNDRNLVAAALQRHVGVRPEQMQGLVTVMDRWEKRADGERIAWLTELGFDPAQIDRIHEFVGFDLGAVLALVDGETRRRSNLAAVLERGLHRGPVRFEPKVVRGFTYYTSTVFEVFDTAPENRRSIFGGGRYDDLASLFIPERIPGIGFAVGDVTLWNFLASHDLLPAPRITAQATVVATTAELQDAARGLARELRDTGLRVTLGMQPEPLRNALRAANRTGAAFCVVLAEEEWRDGQVLVKRMSDGEQWKLAPADVLGRITATD